MSFSAGDYRPRDAEHAVLYRVIEEHLDAFLEAARRHADGALLPEFVEQEFRDFLTCGVLAHVFARVRCTDCADTYLFPQPGEKRLIAQISVDRIGGFGPKMQSWS